MKKANGKLNPGLYDFIAAGPGAGGLSDHLEEAYAAGAGQGTQILGNDTGPGPWLLLPGKTKWERIMVAGGSFPAANVLGIASLNGADGPTSLGGTPGASISPDGSKAAWITQQYVHTCANLQSSSRSVTLTNMKTGWTGNGPHKSVARKIQIDRNNPNVIYAVQERHETSTDGTTWTPSSVGGLYRSLDFGGSFTKNSGVAAANYKSRSFNSSTGKSTYKSGSMALALWHDGPVVSGRTGTLATYSEGVGISISTDGGDTWALANSAGMPNPVLYDNSQFTMCFTRNGALMVCYQDSADGLFKVKRYASGAWTSIPITLQSIAPHPTDSTKTWGNLNGTLALSADGGATWTSLSATPLRVGGNIGWHGWTYEDNMGPGEMIYSPRFSGLSFVQGISVWKSSNHPTTSGTPPTPTWTSYGDGMENMVAHHVRTVPLSTAAIAAGVAGNLNTSFHDRIGAVQKRANLGKAYPSNHLQIRPTTYGDATYGSGWSGVIQHGSPIWEALDNPNWQAVQAGVFTYYTANAWATPATRCAAQNGSNVGDLCVRNAGEIFVVGPGAKNGRYTLDSGATWQPFDFGSATTLMAAVDNYNDPLWPRNVLTRDDSTGDLYMVTMFDQSNAAASYAICPGTWRLPAGTTQWVRTGTKLPSEYAPGPFGGLLTANQAIGIDFWKARLTHVPGKPGHMFWCADGGDGMSYLLFTSNRGQDWATVGPTGNLTVAPMQCCHSVTFGMTLPGASYPIIGVQCRMTGTMARAQAEGLSPLLRPWFFLIQDFNPASPGSATPEALTLTGGYPVPGGAWTEPLGIAGWSDSADFAVVYGNMGIGLLKYTDRASGY